MKNSFKGLLVIVIALFSIKGYAIRDIILNTKQISKMATKKVLIVVTSASVVKSNGKPTGLWIEEFASPYYLFSAAGFEITVASPNGGKAPIDPKSKLPDFSTETTKKFFTDPAAQEKLNNTIKLSDVNPKDYDAVYYPGGTGPTWDLPENKYSIHIIETFYQEGKPTALVCHAPAALKNVKDAHGQALVKDKKIAGYSNSEEAAGQSRDMVSFSLEDMVRAEGGIYVKGEDWHPFVVNEGNLITGQNPGSSMGVAQKIIDALK
jgi:putative intracellular protease/amidase